MGTLLQVGLFALVIGTVLGLLGAVGQEENETNRMLGYAFVAVLVALLVALLLMITVG